MNRQHLVPLSKQMVEILKNQKIQSNDEYVFCSVFNKSKVMNKSTINQALKTMGLNCTAHDFRATASKILHEKITVQNGLKCNSPILIKTLYAVHITMLKI